MDAHQQLRRFRRRLRHLRLVERTARPLEHHRAHALGVWQTVAAVLVALTAASAAFARAPASFVIQGDHRIGSYAVQRDGSLRGLIAAFGEASTVKPGGSGYCRAVWRPIGLTVQLYNLGGANPCTPSGGRFSEATMTGSRWRTAVGLRVGDPVRRIRALYRRAEQHGGSWWLVTRDTQATGRYPGLAAKVRNGRVAAFSVIFQAGGE